MAVHRYYTGGRRLEEIKEIITTALLTSIFVSGIIVISALWIADYLNKRKKK